MDFYYEVGSRPSMKILVLLEFCPNLKVSLKDLTQLDNKESSMANVY
jgi:hypothetical protein